jgi:hypothetical protein
MTDISDELKEIKNALEQDQPWIYLVEIDLPVYGMKRLCSYIQPIDFNDHTWEPSPFAVSGIKISSNGELTTAQVVIGNAAGFFTDYLNDNDGLIGYSGNIYRLSKAKLDDPVDSVIPHLFKILTSSMIAEHVVFNLSLGIDLYGIEGPIVDYDLDNSPSLPYGPPRVSIGIL